MSGAGAAVSILLKNLCFPIVAVCAASLVACAQAPAAAPPVFSVVEATIPDMQRALEQHRVSSRELVTQYLTRIALYDKRINAAISINPRALEEADARDRERSEGKVRGPLHGIPIALKDNIHTTDMPTTGGALAFANFTPPYDATLTKNLRDAGAILIAKAVLTELANWVAGAPTPMPGNYSAVGGFAFNPYDPRPDPRPARGGSPVLSTGGSSSGAGTAANFWAANVGTDTAGSVVNPAMLTMLVGIRPTTGLISRHGIIPITADQDTAGPMARTVTDAAILLSALVSAGPDPNDAATSRCTPPPDRDYTKFLRADALHGARIGIPRAFYYEPLPSSAAGPVPRPGAGERARGGLTAPQAALMTAAIDVLKRAGATIVDPADLPTVLETDPSKNVLRFEICSGVDQGTGKDSSCSSVLKYGMKRDFNAYLATLGASAPVKSLTELRAFNTSHASANAIRYGQSNLDISDELDLVQYRAHYEADRARDLALAADRGFKAAIEANKLDALLFPGWNISNLASRPGYPEIVVPIGFVPPNANGLPPGFDAKPSPYSAALVGLPCSEPRLIEMAYAFEQLTKSRVPPPETNK
jgi:amidase